MVRVRFLASDGRLLQELEAQDGLRLLDLAQDNGVPMEGACEGAMACSTCHVIVADGDFDRLPPPRAEEEDMLDYAYGVAPTSRLACQIWLTDALEALTVRLPPATRNLISL